MAREVTHTATEPLKLDAEDLHPEKGDVAVCRCGLSADYPFCDGSHRNVEEDPGVHYKYEGDDDEGERRRIERIVYADE